MRRLALLMHRPATLMQFFFTSHWLGEARAIAIRCHLVVVLLDNAFATISLRQVKTRPIF
ncbi:hypothetical protein [Nostoc sp. NZL]|uniref:hypothetical protein n=1 Tax=Nostoc sp. NZL TaxID=2650612 RepID=UPI0018C61593|nr:hypothetical protein [Nostoc sp. NZL]